MGRVVHLVSAEGFVEKRAGFFSARLRFARCRGDVACFAQYLEAGPSREEPFCTKSPRLEDGTLSCLHARFPVAGLPSCGFVRHGWQASCLTGPFADFRTLFLGMGRSPALSASGGGNVYRAH